MRFVTTRINGVFLIEPEPIEDDRGFFARTWCRREFAEHGLNPELVQCSVSFNGKKGTLRGMHYQVHPHCEAKLVRCTMGAIYDVIIDLRPGSGTFMEWMAVELTSDNRKMLYVPEETAHGFQTLADRTEVFYQMSEYYAPQAARGIRWNDPCFDIAWPEAPTSISEKDGNYPDFIPQQGKN